MSSSITLQGNNQSFSIPALSPNMAQSERDEIAARINALVTNDARAAQQFFQKVRSYEELDNYSNLKQLNKDAIALILSELNLKESIKIQSQDLKRNNEEANQKINEVTKRKGLLDGMLPNLDKERKETVKQREELAKTSLSQKQEVDVLTIRATELEQQAAETERLSRARSDSIDAMSQRVDALAQQRVAVSGENHINEAKKAISDGLVAVSTGAGIFSNAWTICTAVGFSNTPTFVSVGLVAGPGLAVVGAGALLYGGYKTVRYLFS